MKGPHFGKSFGGFTCSFMSSSSPTWNIIAIPERDGDEKIAWKRKMLWFCTCRQMPVAVGDIQLKIMNIRSKNVIVIFDPATLTSDNVKARIQYCLRESAIVHSRGLVEWPEINSNMTEIQILLKLILCSPYLCRVDLAHGSLVESFFV